MKFFDYENSLLDLSSAFDKALLNKENFDVHFAFIHFSDTLQITLNKHLLIHFRSYKMLNLKLNESVLAFLNMNMYIYIYIYIYILKKSTCFVKCSISNSSKDLEHYLLIIYIYNNK